MNSYEFRDHLNETTGVDLSDFFDKWVFRGGFPHFSIDSTQLIQNGTNYDVSVFVKQKLTGTPFYFSNVPLTVLPNGFPFSSNLVFETLNFTTCISVASPSNPNTTFDGVNLFCKFDNSLF